jgi:hypothetical protein
LLRSPTLIRLTLRPKPADDDNREPEARLKSRMASAKPYLIQLNSRKLHRVSATLWQEYLAAGLIALIDPTRPKLARLQPGVGYRFDGSRVVLRSGGAAKSSGAPYIAQLRPGHDHRVSAAWWRIYVGLKFIEPDAGNPKRGKLRQGISYSFVGARLVLCDATIKPAARITSTWALVEQQAIFCHRFVGHADLGRAVQADYPMPA